MKYNRILVLALATVSFLMMNQLSAQRSRIDSLSTFLVQASGEARIPILHEMARLIAPDSLELANTYMNEALTVAEQRELHATKADLLLTKAALYQRYQRKLIDEQRSVNYYLEANRFCQEWGNNHCQAFSAYQVGIGYLRFGEYEQALYHLFRASSQFESMQDSANLIACFVALGEVFQKTNAIEQANKYSRLALATADATGADSLRAKIYYNLGSFNLSKKVYQTAWSYLNESYRLTELYLPESEQVNPLNKIAETQAAVGSPIEAIANYRKALGIAKKYELAIGQAESHFGLATLFYLQEDFAQSHAHLDTSTQICESSSLPYQLLKNYELYQKLAIDEGNVDVYHLYASLLTKKQDSLQVSRKEDLVRKMETLYETHQKDVEIVRNELELSKEGARKKIAIMVGVILLMLVLFLFFLYYINKQNNKRLEKEVQERTKELDETNLELDVLAYRTAHDIRGPVARLLGLGQLASGSESEQDIATYVNLMNQEAMQMDVMLHRFLEVNNIKDQHDLDDYVSVEGVIHTILEEFQELEAAKHLRVELNLSPNLYIYTNPPIFEILLRNVMENAFRFYREGGEDQYLRISAWKDSGNLQMKFMDNGIGIHEEISSDIFKMFFRGTHTSQGLGLGLYSAKMAADRLGASIEYYAENQDETEFRISF